MWQLTNKNVDMKIYMQLDATTLKPLKPPLQLAIIALALVTPNGNIELEQQCLN